jgi:hypothetical protein
MVAGPDGNKGGVFTGIFQYLWHYSQFMVLFRCSSEFFFSTGSRRQQNSYRDSSVMSLVHRVYILCRIWEMHLRNVCAYVCF